MRYFECVAIITAIFAFFALFGITRANAEPIQNCQNFGQIDMPADEIESILVSENVPAEFIYLAIAESRGRPEAVSKKGAAGLWQLMPATARRYGLIVNPKQDDRFDINKSTRAAAKYLRHLLDDFHGDWSWTIAAYNAGGHNLRAYYQRGAKVAVLKTDYPEAYGLSVTVMRMINEKCQVEVKDE